MENNTDNFSEENFLFNTNKKNPFSLPEGYLNDFSVRLLNRIEHEHELKGFKTLKETTRQLKFTVPQNYFITLANLLERKYEISAHPVLNSVAKPLMKSLPVNYFEALDKKLIERMELENELKGFSVLSSVDKKNNFKLVPDYFDNITVDVKDKIHPKIHTPGFIEQVINILFQPKMAFTLGFILIVGFTSVWYLNKKEPNLSTGDCKTLACLEKNELLNEKNIPDFDDENLYEMVDVEMLDKQMTKENTGKGSVKKNHNK
jgi:hypothetical protein